MKAIQEQIILITGSTDGLGKKVATDLAGKGASVILHGRNPDKGKKVLQEIRSETGNEWVRYYNADLASQKEVRHLADELNRDLAHLDVLINNAGVGARSPAASREISSDGYELRFAVNYLSHYLLTRSLLSLLKKSSPSRIVNVASVGQQPIDFDDVMLEKGYDDLRAYRQSKLAQVIFTFDLATELQGSGVTVNALHPASLMNTNMVRGSTGYFPGVMTTVEAGAEAVEYLAISADLDGISGEYYNMKQKARANPQAYDEKAWRRLRLLSDRLII